MASRKMDKTVADKPASKTREATRRVINEHILCHSVIPGALYITCKSGNSYEFNDYGGECEIEANDLIALIRKRSEHIFIPRFVIDDQEFLEDFPQVSAVYENMYDKERLEEILDMNIDDMESEIASMPVSSYDNMRQLISTEIAAGKLDSVRKIKKLSEIFDSDFNLISELFGK